VATADDARLTQLASGRAAELFGILNRTTAWTPLVVLWAILPGLFVLHWQTLGTSDALWGLRSLDILSTSDWVEMIRGDSVEAVPGWKWQPPLGSWLTALVMSVAGPAQPLSLVLVSFVSTIGVVISSFVLLRRLLGPRFAFFATFMLACQGSVLWRYQAADPASLATLFALWAIWGAVGHAQDFEGWISLKLLIGGISLGLCLLAGGPLAITVLVALLLASIGRHTNGGHTGHSKRLIHRSVTVGWPAIKSLLLMGLMAFAVGGWWGLMVSSRDGLEFWHGWFYAAGPMPAPTASWTRAPGTVSLASSAIRQLVDLLGILCGLSLFGTWRACHEVLRPTNPLKRRAAILLLTWTGCALFLRGPAMLSASAPAAPIEQLFLLLPLIALAAFAVEEISARHVHVIVAVGVVVLSVAATFWRMLVPLTGIAPIAATQGWTTGLVVALLAGLLWWLSNFTRSRDSRQRAVLSLLLVAVLSAHAVGGFASVAARPVDVRRDDLVLAAVRDRMAATDGFDACTFIAAADLPPQLRFLVRSLQPQVVPTIAANWELAEPLILNQTFGRRRAVLIVEWGGTGNPGTTPPIRVVKLNPVSPSDLYWGRFLRTFLVTSNKTSR